VTGTTTAVLQINGREWMRALALDWAHTRAALRTATSDALIQRLRCQLANIAAGWRLLRREVR